MNPTVVCAIELGPNWVQFGKGCRIVRKGLSGKIWISLLWMGGRAVLGTGLENRRGCKLTVGSNPTPSAIDSSPRNAFELT